jgi:hypothetical protein
MISTVHDITYWKQQKIILTPINPIIDHTTVMINPKDNKIILEVDNSAP